MIEDFTVAAMKLQCRVVQQVELCSGHGSCVGTHLCWCTCLIAGVTVGRLIVECATVVLDAGE